MKNLLVIFVLALSATFFQSCQKDILVDQDVVVNVVPFDAELFQEMLDDVIANQADIIGMLQDAEEDHEQLAQAIAIIATTLADNQDELMTLLNLIREDQLLMQSVLLGLVDQIIDLQDDVDDIAADVTNIVNMAMQLLDDVEDIYNIVIALQNQVDDIESMLGNILAEIITLADDVDDLQYLLSQLEADFDNFAVTMVQLASDLDELNDILVNLDNWDDDYFTGLFGNFIDAYWGGCESDNPGPYCGNIGTQVNIIVNTTAFVNNSYNAYLLTDSIAGDSIPWTGVIDTLGGYFTTGIWPPSQIAYIMENTVYNIVVSGAGDPVGTANYLNQITSSWSLVINYDLVYSRLMTDLPFYDELDQYLILDNVLDMVMAGYGTTNTPNAVYNIIENGDLDNFTPQQILDLRCKIYQNWGIGVQPIGC